MPAEGGVRSQHRVVGTSRRARVRKEAFACRFSSSEESGAVQGRLSRSCIAGFGARAVNCENSVGGGPQQRIAEASAQVARLEALQLFGEDDPVAEPLKVVLKKARVQAQVRPVGERLDLCLQHIARVKKHVARAEDHVRAAREVRAQMEEKLANGLRDLFVQRRPNSLDSAQAAHAQGWSWKPKSSRSKKARTLGGISTDLSPMQRGVSAHNPSDVMMTLIDAADATLRTEARWGMRGVRVGEASHPGPPGSLLRRLRTSRQGALTPIDSVVI